MHTKLLKYVTMFRVIYVQNGILWPFPHLQSISEQITYSVEETSRLAKSQVKQWLLIKADPVTSHRSHSCVHYYSASHYIMDEVQQCNINCPTDQASPSISTHSKLRSIKRMPLMYQVTIEQVTLL